MVDIIHRMGVKSPATQVYRALSSLEGLAQWGTEQVLLPASVAPYFGAATEPA